MQGQFAWYELSTTDPAAAQQFYKTFSGWSSQPFDADYTLLTSNGTPVAGVFNLTDELKQQGVPPNWMPYVEANNVAETTKLAASLGAKVMYGPTEIQDVGDIAVVQDPQGATFGIYKSKSGAPSWDGTPVVGHFSWNELMAVDQATAFDFYRRLFGWEKISEMDMGDGMMYMIFGKGGAMYGGMFTRTADMQNIPPFWMCYIQVNDVPKAVATATKSGATLHRGPMDIPGGVIAILGDPQGAAFALHHQSSDPQASTSVDAAKPAAKTAAKKAKKTVKKAKAGAKKSKVAASKSKVKSAAKSEGKKKGKKKKDKGKDKKSKKGKAKKKK